MPKQEFNDKGRSLKDFYDTLGIEPPVRSAEEEVKLEKSLEALKKLRERDPNFEQAWRDFVEAEVKYGKDDPAEGKIVISKDTGPKRSK